MRTSFILEPQLDGPGRVRETAETLLMLKSRPDADWQLVRRDLPSWLTSEFAPEQSVEEAEEWLVKWRAAPDQSAFEQESGWTASGWLHWFSSENEFWSIGDVDLGADGRSLTVTLEHDDYHIPLEALRWLATVAGLQVTETD